MSEQEWPGWGDDDWDDEKVREDLLRLVTTYDGAPEHVVARRRRAVRMWAAVESARARAGVVPGFYADDSSPTGEATDQERT